MKKFVFAAIAVVAVVFISLGLYAQPGGMGGGGMGGPGGGMMGGMGGPGGGMMGGGTPMVRLDKKARLEAVKELEKQIAALKETVNKAPDKDPNVAALTGDALTKFMDVFTPESDAINKVQSTLTKLRGTPAGGGMMGGGMMGMFGGMGGRGPTEDVLNELKTLATGDKATKTTARIDALIKEAQNRARMMEEMMGGMGGGMMGGPGGPGGAGAPGAPGGAGGPGGPGAPGGAGGPGGARRGAN